jgi:ATP-dependent DNA ligase
VHRFAALFESLDTTNSTSAKIEAMVEYFRATPPADAAWAVYVLMGRRVKRSVGQSLLHAWLVEESGLPPWLVDETYGSVGDLAETIALLLAAEDPPADTVANLALHEWFTQRILPLADADVATKRRQVTGWWRQLRVRECFLVNKLLTGALRVGVSRSLVTRALALTFEQPRAQIERALIGEWQPSALFWEMLSRNEASSHVSHPYPFFLASPLEGSAESLGVREDWLAEWKWDGIRGQIVRRQGECTLWSRGEEIITGRFPEIALAAESLPDCVMDGEVVGWQGDRVLPFGHLQQRIGRLKLSAQILKDVPARFIAYDLLELQGADMRARPLRERRLELGSLLERRAQPAITLSAAIGADSWQELAAKRQQARELGVEGIMLKNWQSTYGVGRQRGAWWKWKVDPFSFDGVLLYAAPGNGRRSNLYTDYTFGVWNGDVLVPVAKAYSGLNDEEIRELDRWIRAHTLEKFGIVRKVETQHVFELAYEGIARSTRHKSGIALRFPRILRWRRDKTVSEADRLSDLQSVLAEQRAVAGGGSAARAQEAS